MKLENLELISENINLDDYIKERDIVKTSMKYPEWLGDFSREQLTKMLKDKSRIWMYYLDNDFVCSMMLIPGSEKSVQKMGLRLNWEDVVDYGPMFVNSKYVGNGLQYQMLKELDRLAWNNGYKYAISTVHPENSYSINNLVKDNFEMVGVKEFTRGIREIYVKKLVR